MALFYMFESLSDVGLAGESWVPLSGSGSSPVPYSVLTEVSESCAASQMLSQKRRVYKSLFRQLWIFFNTTNGSRADSLKGSCHVQPGACSERPTLC